jgi:uncharacterized protein involved in exopolysaccharide biosynthesis
MAQIPQQIPPPSTFKPEDILFVLFRQKWKILVFSLLGLIGAAAVYFKMPRIYESEAKLLLRYVLERKSLSPIGTDAQIQSPDSRGENIINSELEILKSFDLASQVAESVGPEKILGKSMGESNRIMAAIVIRKSLSIDVAPKSSVIRLAFQHQNPAVVQPVLEKLIEGYLRKHLEIHRAVGLADEFLSQQTEQLRFKLSKIEDDLWNLKTNSGSVSAEDFKGFSERRTKILQDLSTAEAQLEEKQAVMQELQKFLPPKAGAPQQVKAEGDVPLEKMNEYKKVCDQLTSAKTNLTALLSKFNEETPFVQRTQALVSKYENLKLQLEKEYPKLAGLDIPSGSGNLQPLDLTNLSSEIRVLEIKIKAYKNQIEKIGAEELAFAKAQNGITQLQRQKEVDEANYKYYASSMEQARIDETLGPGKISNIKSVQDPTPPAKVPGKTIKIVGGALAGGVLGGIGLAFLIEMFLDKTVKRPGEIKNRLNISVFSTIPYLNGKSRRLAGVRNLLPWNKNSQPSTLNPQPTNDLRPPSSESGPTSDRRPQSSVLRPPASESGPTSDPRPQSSVLRPPSSASAPTSDLRSLTSDSSPPSSVLSPLTVCPWESEHRLQPYFQEVRDHLINFFEARNMAHKPKLVAVTSCSKGAGVSTLAAGLAASLSEAADGNVLLVDMHSSQGGAHPFYKGKPGWGLRYVFELEKR